MKRQMVMLGGLNCPNCAAKLEKAAQKLAGMKSAKVSFATGTLQVEYNEEQVSEERIRALVEQFGLEVASVLPAAAR